MLEPRGNACPLFLLFICLSFHKVSATTNDGPQFGRHSLTTEKVQRRLFATSVPTTPKTQHMFSVHQRNHNPLKNHDFIANSSLLKDKKGFTQEKPSKVFSNTFVDRDVSRERLGGSRASIVGSLLMYFITLIVTVSLCVTLACLLQKWKQNNVAAETKYPKVEYSMLRRGEEEPEDPMNEILVNIGLALPEEVHAPSESETDDSKLTSPAAEPSSFGQEETLPNCNVDNNSDEELLQ